MAPPPARAASHRIDRMLRDPGRYDYLPLIDRPKIRWPNGARVAFWVGPNIEFYELNPPDGQGRPIWPRPYPDVLNYSLRDYGNRAGVWRVMEALDAIRRSRQRFVECSHVRPHARDRRRVRAAEMGAVQSRHLQHAAHLRHERRRGPPGHPRQRPDHQAAQRTRLSRAGLRPPSARRRPSSTCCPSSASGTRSTWCPTISRFRSRFATAG